MIARSLVREFHTAGWTQPIGIERRALHIAIAKAGGVRDLRAHTHAKLNVSIVLSHFDQ